MAGSASPWAGIETLEAQSPLPCTHPTTITAMATAADQVFFDPLVGRVNAVENGPDVRVLHIRLLDVYNSRDFHAASWTTFPILSRLWSVSGKAIHGEGA